MQFSFSNKLRKLLKNDQTIKKNYGQLYGPIKVCLSVIESQDYLELIPNVPPTRRHKLSNNMWALDLNKNWRMIIKPVNEIEPSKINKIIIEDIVDYHS